MSVYARATGATVYFIYLSSRAGIAEASRAREEGANVFVETRPLYLFLDESRYSLAPEEANRYVCLPPLRTPDDQEALWAGIATGEIDTYATDHVAWNSSQKGLEERPFTEVPAGMANVQTSIGMLYAEGVVKGRMSLQRFVEVTATNPARIFGLWPQKGEIAVGSDADLVLLDPTKRVELTREGMASNADFEIFEGRSCLGWPVVTIARGEIVSRDGRLSSSPGRGRFVPRAPV
jgi:dihydropyrimidinase